MGNAIRHRVSLGWLAMTEEEAVAVLRGRGFRLAAKPGGGYGVYPDWRYVSAERLVSTAELLLAADAKRRPQPTRIQAQ